MGTGAAIRARRTVPCRRHQVARHVARQRVPQRPLADRRATPTDAVYRRRRRVAGAAVGLAVAIVTLGAHAILSGPGGGPASAAGVGATAVVRTVRAQPGDSLWSIAQEHRGTVSIDRYVDALVDLNGGTMIEVGQRVRLP